ncbi:MAG: DUF4349 domain-containing protein [Candidatus Micrarchaeia archaeon]
MDGDPLRLLSVFLIMALLAFGCIGSEAGVGRNIGSSVSAMEKAVAPDSGAGGAQVIAKAGQITVKVPEGALEERFQAAKDQLRSQGAEIGNVAYTEYGDRKQYSLTIMIVPSKFEQVQAMLQKIGEVKDMSVQIEDITQQYTDLETRIKNREFELARLQKLYDQSENISDLLSVERELTRVETDLEILKQQKQYLDSRVQRSTIVLNIYEDKPATQQLSLSVEGLGAMFFGAVAAAITLLVLAAGFLIPLALVALALWLVYTKVLRQDRARPRQPERSRTQSQQ